MIDRKKIGEEIKVMFCWHSYCPECVLYQYNCLNTTPEEAIMVARKHMDVFLKKFNMMNAIMGEKDERSTAAKIVFGAKMK